MAETRSLLLTDVVDSTKLSEALGDAAMAELWAAHDRVARDLLVDHDGLEIDKTDGFLLLFDQADQAMAYAVAYHRAIGELDPPIKARAGLHVGPVILTQNSRADVARGAKPLEVDGIAKPTAARVMSVARGGQTLLTPEAHHALTPSVLRSESHGHWRMKGVSEPIELFEVGDGDAPFTPPPDGAKVYRVVESEGLWVPVRQVKHNLPAERDVFIGRTRDLQTLALLLADSRLVSVLGMGGTGKTRLVARFAWTWLGDYPGGVWFCDVSEARSVDGIVSAVARALNVPLGRGDPVVQLGHAIAGRGPCLIVLDNFEQVARYAQETLGPWLDRAGEARFVVTTREVLGLPGETALPLAPLVKDESFDLFVARAMQTKPGFVVVDAESIRALVTLLDGLPLAIELAAARVRLMPPKTLLKRMGQRFKLLASKGGRHTRQATLRGALDWSWDLLSTDEQSALAQLSVFEGGLTLPAAEGVLELAEMWPIDAVQGLVDKSLVRRVTEASSDAVRLTLLMSVQEYAAEKLQQAGEVDNAESRHASYYAQFGTPDALEALNRHGGTEARLALQRELGNVVVACRRSVVSGAGDVAVALLEAAWAVLQMTGPSATGIDLARRVAAIPDLPTVALEATERLQGTALEAAGRSGEARAHYQESLALSRQLRSPAIEGRALGKLAFLHTNRGRMDEALAYFDAALAIQRELGDHQVEGWLLTNLGIRYMSMGQMDEARDYYDAALAAHRQDGNRRSEGHVLSNLAVLQMALGHMDRALVYCRDALAIHREVGNRKSEGRVLTNLGNVCLLQGRVQEARDYCDAALAIHREVGNRRSEGNVLTNLGALHLELGQMDQASTHSHDALAIHVEVGHGTGEAAALGVLGSVCMSQQRVDEARAYFDRSLLICREVGDLETEGHALEKLGILDMKQGRADEARAHFEAALVAAREVGDRLYEGVVLGSLGRLDVSEGRGREAHAHLAKGERLLRDVGDPIELAKLLSDRAQLEAHDGDVGAARKTLAEAKNLADLAGLGPDSPVGERLTEAGVVIDGMDGHE